MTATSTIQEPAPRSQWATTLGELCDRFGGGIQTGPFGSQLHASDYVEDGTPVVMPQDLHDGEIVCDRIARVPARVVVKLPRHALRFGDVVFSRRGDVTRFAVVTHEQEGWLCGTGCIRIRLNCPEVNIPFFRRYLQQGSVGSWLKHHAKGVTMPNLNTDIVRKLPFVYPPLPEQRRIAAILDKSEALRAKRSEAVARARTLAEAIFGELFGDPVRNIHSYPISMMGDVCDVRDGTHDSPKYVSDGGFPLITSKNLSKGFLDLSEVNRISAADFEQVNRRSRVDRGDILLPMIGTIGSPVIVDIEPSFAIKNVALIKFTSTSPSNKYVHHLLNGRYFKYVLEQTNRGGTQKFVSLGDLRKFPIPLPSVNELREFDRRITVTRSFERVQQDALTKLHSLFATLQHRAFRGEL